MLIISVSEVSNQREMLARRVNCYNVVLQKRVFNHPLSLKIHIPYEYSATFLVHIQQNIFTNLLKDMYANIPNSIVFNKQKQIDVIPV